MTAPVVFGTTGTIAPLLDTSILPRFLALPQNGKIAAEYVWIGGSMSDLRSKTRCLDKIPKGPEDLPVWNYDGSSTGQAPGTSSCPVDCASNPINALIIPPCLSMPAPQATILVFLTLNRLQHCNLGVRDPRDSEDKVAQSSVYYMLAFVEILICVLHKGLCNWLSIVSEAKHLMQTSLGLTISLLQAEEYDCR